MGEARRGVPRFFACLVKGPLGCLAFLLGAAAVLVLLFPPAFGRFADRGLERWFAEHHEGELDLGDVWVGSLFGAQRIERFVLRDPDGDEVLRARLAAPALEGAFAGPVHRFGPVRLEVELLRLAEAADGSTNLERALRPRVPASTRTTYFETDVRFEISLEVVIERLRCARASGEERELSDLVLRGLLEWGPESTHLSLAGGARVEAPDALRALLELGRPESVRGAPWKLALELEHAPALLARVASAVLRPLAPLLGADLDRLRWARDGDEVELLVEDGGARLELRGPADAEGVALSAEAPGRATLPCAAPRSEAWLSALVPLWRSLACDEPEAFHELRFAGRWPLRGDWRALDGALVLAMPPARLELAPALAAQLAREGPAPLAGARLELSLRAGVLGFDAVHLPLEGVELRVDGRVDLARGAVALDVAAPGWGLHLGDPAPAPLTPTPPETLHEAGPPSPPAR